MPSIDFLQEWQRAEAACSSAYQAMYAKVKRGAYVDADEMTVLARLSHEARVSYHRYLEQVANAELPGPLPPVR